MVRKGMIRIIEATIGAVIVLSAMIVIASGEKTENPDFNSKIQIILEKIAKNKTLREDVLNGNENDISDFVGGEIDSHLKFSVKICELDDLCPLDNYPYGKEVHSVSRVISVNSDSSGFNPKKIKIFLWSSG